MKTIKTILTTVVPAAMLMSSNVTMAEQNENGCAVISTKKVPINRDKRELILTSHNGKHLFGVNEKIYIPSAPGSRGIENLVTGPGSANIQSGTSLSYRRYEKLILTPGIHHFTGYAAGKLIKSTLNNSTKSARGGKEFSFTINVEAGKFYNLIAARTYPRVVNPVKKFHPTILASKDTECDLNKVNKFYTAVSVEPEVINSAALPQQLEAEFRQLMVEINDYYQQNKPGVDGVAISRNAAQDYVFGISGAPDSKGLKITVVGQSSTAEALGLQKNDVLVSVNGKNISADNLKVLSQEIGNTEPGNKLVFVVQRDGKQITLNKEYRPATLPAFQINMDLASAR